MQRDVTDRLQALIAWALLALGFVLSGCRDAGEYDFTLTVINDSGQPIVLVDGPRPGSCPVPKPVSLPAEEFREHLRAGASTTTPAYFRGAVTPPMLVFTRRLRLIGCIPTSFSEDPGFRVRRVSQLQKPSGTG